MPMQTPFKPARSSAAVADSPSGLFLAPSQGMPSSFLLIVSYKWSAFTNCRNSMTSWRLLFTPWSASSKSAFISSVLSAAFIASISSLLGSFCRIILHFGHSPGPSSFGLTMPTSIIMVLSPPCCSDHPRKLLSLLSSAKRSIPPSSKSTMSPLPSCLMIRKQPAPNFCSHCQSFLNHTGGSRSAKICPRSPSF